MSISIVIPNYNGEKILRVNFPKVVKVISKYKEKKEIIITDDASTDSSISILQELKKKHESSDLKIKIITHDKNRGFSSNVNSGVAQASGEIVILLNTDITPEEGFLEPLLVHFKDPSVFAVGCMDKSIEGKNTVLRGRGLGAWKRGLLIHGRGEVDAQNTLWVSCGSGAFRKSIWEKLGGLDTLFDPFYWEDIDLSYRAVKSGYKILFEPKSVVIHEHAKGSILTQKSKEQINAAAYRNQFTFIWKNVTDSRLVISHLFWLDFHVFRALVSGNITLVKGYIHALARLPKVFSSRRNAQKLFQLSDKETIQKAHC